MGSLRETSWGERREPPLERVLAALRRRQVLPYVPRDGVVVDLGCGYHADLLARIAPQIREGVGIDLSVADRPPAPNVRLLRGEVDAPLPLAADSVDLVSCLAVLEHVARPTALLAEARRVLRGDGVLVVTTPATTAKPILELLSNRLRAIDQTEISDHERYYTAATLRRELERAGFPPDRVRVRRFELGLNLAAVARA